MARITRPLEGVPGFNFNGLQIDVPVDLPEGGHLCVIVGDSPVGIPVTSVALPKGCMIGIIPPHIAEQIRPGIVATMEQLARAQANGGGPRPGIIAP